MPTFFPALLHIHRVAIYLRVSTLDQTTANQEHELREVASRMGCE
jgi:DNA invertase Pin-like site-specific DNA recombinase